MPDPSPTPFTGWNQIAITIGPTREPSYDIIYVEHSEHQDVWYLTYPAAFGYFSAYGLTLFSALLIVALFKWAKRVIF